MIRTVDQSKCVGCGTCQKVCPLDVFRLETRQLAVSPCKYACPIQNDMREMHYLLQMGRVDDAARMMLQSNPLASVTGRICPAFCESECTRAQVDSAVNISAIEQYLGDYLLEEKVEPMLRRHVAPIAVVGSGPASLTCAYFLAADGFRVTMFEAKNEPGGMLRYAIPEFRLPDRVTASLIERLQGMGVTIQCGMALNDAFTIDGLRAQGFGAVFLGVGAGRAKKIEMEGIDAEGIYPGLEFLEGVRTGSISSMKQRVAVVGGGDVAMDVAQTARRLGAESVTVIALEDDTTLPAYRRNIDAAKAERIEILCSRGIDKILQEGGRVKGLRLVRCTSVFDQQGVFAPAYDRADCSDVPVDLVILAVGQEPDISSLPEDLVSAKRLIKADLETTQTSLPYVFGAGDAIRGSTSVAHAIAGGKRAAQAIMFYLKGMELEWLPPLAMPVTGALPEKAQIPRAKRHERVLAAQGPNPFQEKYTGLDLVQMLAEADRCMTCGAKSVAAHLDDCMTCFACELGCPSEAIFVHPFKEILPRSLRPIGP